MNPGTAKSGERTEPKTKMGCWVIGCVLFLLFPVVKSFFTEWNVIRRNSRRTEAGNACKVLVAALDQFHTEYGRYPFSGDAAAGADRDGDTAMESRLVPILNGTDKTENPLRVNFLGDFRIADIRKHLAGLVRNGDSTGLVDPWGGVFRVRLDTDGNGFVENPEPDAGEKELNKTEIAWSAGKDGNFETWADNVASWID